MAANLLQNNQQTCIFLNSLGCKLTKLLLNHLSRVFTSNYSDSKLCTCFTTFPGSPLFCHFACFLKFISYHECLDSLLPLNLHLIGAKNDQNWLFISLHLWHTQILRVNAVNCSKQEFNVIFACFFSLLNSERAVNFALSSLQYQHKLCCCFCWQFEPNQQRYWVSTARKIRKCHLSITQQKLIFKTILTN